MTIIDACAKNIKTLSAAMSESIVANNKVSVLVCDGSVITITAYHAQGECWYFVDGTVFPYADSGNLVTVAEFLVNYGKKLAKRDADIAKLAAYDKNTQEYSDKYKTIYGRRPR